MAIPVVQFIIGYCNGNDMLCGRKGGHSLYESFCLDCNISPDNGGNTSNQRLLCSFSWKGQHDWKERWGA